MGNTEKDTICISEGYYNLIEVAIICDFLRRQFKEYALFHQKDQASQP
jgi:hypothetical protein